MALHWRPVGPEPASTYWQRRAVVAAAILVPLLLLTTLPGGDDDADTLAGASATAVPSVAPAPGPSPEVSAGPTPTAPAVPICQPDALEISADADQEAYRVGARPRLSLSVTNTGATPCTRDLGQAAVELLVTSGKDRIWSSDDCNPGGPKAVTTLQPGKAVVQRLAWDGRRSRPGCTGAKERAVPGTYRVSGRVGQLRVEGDVFRFTD